MEKPGLPFVFLMLGVVIFANIYGGLGIAKAAEPNVVFSDDFDDGDISDWTVTTSGDATFDVSTDKSVSPPYSVHMSSTGDYKAMGVSPVYDVNISENYNISFSFLIPHTDNHWFEVFNNQQTYVVIDLGTDLKCYLGNYQTKMIKTLNSDEWYDIELRAHQDSNSYDVYVNGQCEETCNMWIHGSYDQTFGIGDRADGHTDRGEAYWDDFVITQPVDSDGDGVVDPNDNCPYDYNPGQEDRNSDGWGDVCECIAANLDGLEPINFLDFSTVASDWDESGTGLAGDINSDEIVDFNDLEILAYHWLSDCN